MNEKEFDQLSLPKGSANENLETKSRLKFAELFSTELFELRHESQHDKGVDIFIELKRRGNYTNFRFAVQLKATHDESYNKDGSASFSIDVSNINYLLNHNMPAYYILYKEKDDIFLYVNAFTVHEELKLKYSDQKLPKTYTYRFEQTLNPATIQQLYDETFEKGLLLRSINPLLQMNLQQNQPSENIVINKRLEVYTTAQKAEYIEKYGFYFLNAAEFEKVIELEQQCYPLPKVTGTFHIVVGMAYYHQANMYRAIDHFKKAAKLTDGLHPEMSVILGYHTAMARFALGLLSRKEIKKVVAKYKNSAYVGLHLRINEAYVDYVTGKEDESVKHSKFYRELDLIKSDPRCDANIQLLADTQAVLVEGQRLNDHLWHELILDRALPVRELFKDTTRFENEVLNYNKKVSALQIRAQEENNTLTFLIIRLNSLKINYTAIATTYCIKNFNIETNSSIYVLEPEAQRWMKEKIILLDETAEFYYQQGFLENMVVALSLKYEILHFLGDITAAEIVKAHMHSVLEANDLVEYQRKFDHLINGGTVHEITLSMLVEHFKITASLKQEADRLREEIEYLDTQEKLREKAHFVDRMNIDIFPLGWFAFPGTAFDDVMDALHVEGAVRSQFEWMLKGGMMSQVNVLHDPVTREGYLEGMEAHRGIESERNLLRIRKHFFDHGYYRLR